MRKQLVMGMGWCRASAGVVLSVSMDGKGDWTDRFTKDYKLLAPGGHRLSTANEFQCYQSSNTYACVAGTTKKYRRAENPQLHWGLLFGKNQDKMSQFLQM